MAKLSQILFQILKLSNNMIVPDVIIYYINILFMLLNWNLISLCVWFYRYYTWLLLWTLIVEADLFVCHCERISVTSILIYVTMKRYLLRIVLPSVSSPICMIQLTLIIGILFIVWLLSYNHACNLSFYIVILLFADA